MKRFVHELRYSRKITHKNVIRIYDFLLHPGQLRHLDGVLPLAHARRRDRQREADGAASARSASAATSCTGMTVAHQVGIVHRDLKPANVLINQEGLLKIVDFGVAAAQREGDTQLTKTGYVIGSPKYMAPEQILGKKVDERADIYAVGVILYEMLTGVPPYSPRRPHVRDVPARAGQGAARAGSEPQPAAGPRGRSSARPCRWTRPSASRPWTRCARRSKSTCRRRRTVRSVPRRAARIERCPHRPECLAAGCLDVARL